MSNKYVIGLGISSLIFCYYNPQYTAIGPKSGVGGKLSNDFMENTVLLHNCPETKEFLTLLDIPVKEKTHLIRYIIQNTVQSDISMIKKLAFIHKKLQNNSYILEDVKMSTDDYFISVLEVNWKEVLEKLKSKVTIINDTVIRITDTEIITETTKYTYDEIVSTIPANIFWDIYYQNTDLKFEKLPVTFALVDDIPAVLVGQKFDLVYFCDNRYKYTRINKKKELFLYEFTGSLTREELKTMLPKEAEIREYYVDNCGIIFTNKNNIPPKNIRFLGRFSQWNHKIKIDDVIKESSYSYNFVNLWNIQRNFYNKVIKPENIQTSEDKEKETHSLILHLFDEISEVLNETNYKKHKRKIDVNIANIREEIIDCFKYILNLCILWGIDEKEFVRIFEEKSKLVEKRWNEENEKM